MCRNQDQSLERNVLMWMKEEIDKDENKERIKWEGVEMRKRVYFRGEKFEKREKKEKEIKKREEFKKKRK